MTGKDVLLDDGVFEVTLIRMPKNPIELNEIIAALVNLVDDTEMIYSFKTNEVHFHSKTPVPWTRDGEYGGDHEELVVKNLCRAVEIIVPET
jgi:diacylglycerol kinase family enzyme